MEIVIVGVTLIVGFLLGLLVAKLRQPKPVEKKYDGVLELVESEEALLVGVAVNTRAEILETMHDATFLIRKTPIS
jgi:hypothetical protein